jgi:hypothetical protein
VPRLNAAGHYFNLFLEVTEHSTTNILMKDGGCGIEWQKE